jgi:serine phosphatase RsbU (regulator of sigma subunit)
MTTSQIASGAAIGGVALLVWLAVSIQRARMRSHMNELGAQARDALTRFADRALELETVHEILLHAKEAAWRLFGCERVVAFEPGADRGTWEAFEPGGETLAPVPGNLRGAFAWFVHNLRTAPRADLGDRRFGAMRAPLRELMDRYNVDLLIPLVEHGRMLAVLGALMNRRPTELDREALMLFRLEVTAACANVKLHRQAAHVLTLAREFDLASAVKITLVPDEAEGSSGPLSWAGHYEAAGQAGSDFYGVYPLTGGRVLVVIGDAVGSGLGGSMVAAVVKSCCDAVHDAQVSNPSPARLLQALNAAIHRPARPAHTRCFAALFEPSSRRVIYANAGHTLPYRMHFGDGGPELGVLAGAGALLGDSDESVYRENRSPVGPREAFLFFTDGLVKATDRRGEPFGDRRLQRVLGAHKEGSAREIRESVLTALAAHRDGGPLPDDLSIVVIRSRAGA